FAYKTTVVEPPVLLGSRKILGCKTEVFLFLGYSLFVQVALAQIESIQKKVVVRKIQTTRK
ncbi:MAG: hypothetical protein NTY32_14105, partial [Bacteroidia bacterium]|nr:hypothetical protein [Bacteroidia bacterium]